MGPDTKYTPPPGEMITEIIRITFYLVSAPGLLPENPARAQKIIPLEFILVRGPFR